MRPGADVEILPAHHRDQEGARRAHPAAAIDRALEVADAFLGRAVVIMVARDTERDGAVDEGVAERVAPVEIGHGQPTVAAPKPVVAVADPSLRPLEIGQDVLIAPAAIAHLRPAVEVEALAAIVDVAVNRAGATEDLAARRMDAPAGRSRRWLRLVEPVHGRIHQSLHETGRDVDERVVVARPGFEHAHRRALVFAQPAR